MRTRPKYRSPQHGGLPKTSRFRPPPASPRRTTKPGQARDLLQSARAQDRESEPGKLVLAGLSLLGLVTAVPGQAHEQVLVQPQQLLKGVIQAPQRETLTGALSSLPAEVLEMLVRDGLDIQIVAPGESLLDKNVIGLKDPETAFSDAAEYTSLVSALPRQGFRAFDRLLRRRTAGHWRAFQPLDHGHGRYSLRDMAREHGGDQGLFIEQVESANSTHLEQVRTQVLERTESDADSGSFLAESAQQRLEQYREDPASIPIDWKAHPVAVPDRHLTMLGEQQLHLSRHDRETLNQWSVENGKVVPSAGLEGQYFGEGDLHTIVLSPLGASQPKTVLHEVGHALLRTVERRWPETYQDLELRIARSYHGLVPSGVQLEIHDESHRYPVSEYARQNPGEYFAEGFAHYVQDPELLKIQDPKLHGLIEEALALVTPPS